DAGDSGREEGPRRTRCATSQVARTDRDRRRDQEDHAGRRLSTQWRDPGLLLVTGRETHRLHLARSPRGGPERPGERGEFASCGVRPGRQEPENAAFRDREKVRYHPRRRGMAVTVHDRHANPAGRPAGFFFSPSESEEKIAFAAEGSADSRAVSCGPAWCRP